MRVPTSMSGVIHAAAARRSAGVETDSGWVRLKSSSRDHGSVVRLLPAPARLYGMQAQRGKVNIAEIDGLLSRCIPWDPRRDSCNFPFKLLLTRVQTTWSEVPVWRHTIPRWG